MQSRSVGNIDFATLFVAHDWAEHHCVVPDGLQAGEPWTFWDWQSWCLLNYYRVRQDAVVGQRAPAFEYRRSQIVLPQKAGKAPYTAAHVCIEGVGPALFAGWATGGETWDCRDHGCGCGWVYEYEPGEAMGARWPTPLIQVTAFSEEQTANIYDALRPMIDDGPLHEVIPRTGEEFIRLPGRGRIDVVTSSARSRLGQRVTFVAMDETGIWTPDAGMVRVAETQRRGLSGMGGRAEETTNAWDPSEGSVAQRTAEAEMADVFRYHPEAPENLDFRKDDERLQILQHVYAGCLSIDIDSIEAEAKEILREDPHQGERFYGNRSRAGRDKAFDVTRFRELARPDDSIQPGARVVLSFDGAKRFDTTVLMATDIERGYQQIIGFWARPADIAADDDWTVDVQDVHQHVADAFDRFDVWRLYGDPPYWRTEMDEWAGKYGEDRVINWATSRRKAMCYATKAWVTDLSDGKITHDGSEEFVDHIRNAVKSVTKMRDEGSPDFLWYPAKANAHSPNKIDAAVTAIIGWEARSDAIAAGVLNQETYETAAW